MNHALAEPAVVDAENGYGASTLARGGALQQVRTTYATAVAVQKPRKLAEVERRLLEEARLSGEDFYYGWSVGKDSIEGPSVALAVAAARCWGNCAIETPPVQDLPDCWVFTSVFVDLETGFTMSRQFRQSKKWVVHGRLDDERKDDVRFQIGQSKSVRNVVLKALPAGLLRKAMDEAKAGVRRSIEEYIAKNSLPKAVDWIVRALGKVGVTEPMILEKLAKADRKAVDVDDLVILRGDLSALEGGKERAETLYPTKDAAKTTTESLRTKLNGGAPQAPVSTPPAAATPATPIAEPEPPPVDDQEEANKDDFMYIHCDRVAEATTEAELADIGAVLTKNRDWIGEDRHAMVLAAYQEKFAKLRPKSAPKKSREF